MVEIAAAVEHDLGDASLDRALGDELANGLCRDKVAALLLVVQLPLLVVEALLLDELEFVALATSYA